LVMKKRGLSTYSKNYYFAPTYKRPKLIQNFVWVSFGGAIGAVLRYAVSLVISSRSSCIFPWPTFCVNMFGCMLIGVISALITTHYKEHQYLAPFLITGVLGGFTTFSSFAFETHQLLSQKAYLIAIIYVVASNLLGIAAAITSFWSVSKILS
jgi:CrcB protein